MVYNGPSKGCRACRKRRVKCDQAKPACNTCTRRKVECPGYDNAFDYRHRNENDSTALRVQQKHDAPRSKCASVTTSISTPDSTSNSSDQDTLRDSSYSPSSADMAVVYSESPKVDVFDAVPNPFRMFELDPDPETVVLNWYFTNYPMKSVDPQSTHGFVPLLKPLYQTAPPDSPLRPAVAAIASNLLMLFCHQGSDTVMARKFYAQAITRMKSQIVDPERSKGDDLILTTLALNFYDMLNLRWNADSSNYHNHQDGAVALLKHRGASNNDNDVSRHVTSVMRTAICHWSMEGEMTISPDILAWLTEDVVPTNKACELDVVTLKMIAYQTRFKYLYQTHAEKLWNAQQETVQALIDDGLTIDTLYANWTNNCPTHWYPLFAPADSVAPSIKQAGLYGDRCSVYWDASVCDAWNTCRLRRLILLRMIRQLCLDKPSPQNSNTLNEIEVKMQTLIDEQCESVPFMIGDVINPMRHTQLYEIKYPSASNGVCTYPNPDHDHPRAAAASGAWLCSSVLVNMAKMSVADGEMEPFAMRQGQFPWVFGQLGRLQRVFLLSQPTHRASWKSFKKF